MSNKMNIILVLVLALAYTKAQGNQLCPCDTKDRAEEKSLLNNLLVKLSSKVNKEEESLYSVSPGLLEGLTCNCEEKQRRKRKIMPDVPVENSSELPTENSSEEAKQQDSVVKEFFRPIDRRCPEGFYRFARHCLKAELFDDYN